MSSSIQIEVVVDSTTTTVALLSLSLECVCVVYEVRRWLGNEGLAGCGRIFFGV